MDRRHFFQGTAAAAAASLAGCASTGSTTGIAGGGKPLFDRYMGVIEELEFGDPLRTALETSVLGGMAKLSFDTAGRLTTPDGSAVQGWVADPTGKIDLNQPVSALTMPPGLVALLRRPGLGPKKIKTVHETLQIESLADLRRAAESGEIATL